LTQIGPSTCPNRRYRQGRQLWWSNFCHYRSLKSSNLHRKIMLSCTARISLGLS
jgi:hypothetical protein